MHQLRCLRGPDAKRIAGLVVQAASRQREFDVAHVLVAATADDALVHEDLGEEGALA